jgi:dTDP-glucose 4,6-dehydratase
MPRAPSAGRPRNEAAGDGGAGFIGSAVVRLAVSRGHEVVNLDAMTYAACEANVAPVAQSNLYSFEHADIRDRASLDRILATHRPDAVMHLAAESHVDRSIDGPGDFIETNITGTFNMLEAARAYWQQQGRPEGFRFHHISTDEVFGSLGDRPVHRGNALRPAQPLFGVQGGLGPSGAGLARNLWPAGGADQLLEQLRALSLSRKADPGGHPERAARAPDPGLWQGRERARLALCRGSRRRAAAGDAEGRGRPQLQHRRRERAPQHRHRPHHLRHSGRDGAQGRPYADQITFVTDRPGHDARYAIDPSRIRENWAGGPRSRSKRAAPHRAMVSGQRSLVAPAAGPQGVGERLGKG